MGFFNRNRKLKLPPITDPTFTSTTITTEIKALPMSDLESELLKPIGEEKVTAAEVVEEKPKTIAEHIIHSLKTEPTKWKDGDSSRTLVHPNGTRLYYYDEWASTPSDPYVSFTDTERKAIVRAILECQDKMNKHKQTLGQKRALDRWTKPAKVAKPGARKS